ncbi:MAG: DNA phosphorothioation system sulfurtransferase DndC, partial [Leptospiraceae bacterium]|nr:DNA phosphorothioation system sulfurtransferase DndC [Leptospiraceae bacterium]
LNLIGKGYPSPNKWFRWCTQRMKIRPTNEYIIKTVDKHGKAIVLLGVRKSESSTRAISMRQFELENVRLRKHNSLRNAYIFAPIADWSTQEVWTYLIHNQCPWGEDVQNLLGLYRSASDVMECPLVIDDTTPSCGNSRFGCWTCTVIDQDKSMGYMIQNGEEWMAPLYNFRNWLKEIRDLPDKREKMKRNLQDGIGPFTIETRVEILERLLKAEKEVGKNLITNTELSAIQLQWHYDGFFKYSVADIYYEKKGFKIMMNGNSKEEEEKEERELLSEICRKNGVNPDHILELIETEKGYLSHYKRRGVIPAIKEKVKKFTLKEKI